MPSPCTTLLSSFYFTIILDVQKTKKLSCNIAEKFAVCRGYRLNNRLELLMLDLLLSSNTGCTNNSANAVFYCFQPTVILHHWNICIFMLIQMETACTCVHATTTQYSTAGKKPMPSRTLLTELVTCRQQKPPQTGENKAACGRQVFLVQNTTCIKKLQLLFCKDKL